MTVALGADHAGFALKESLKVFLKDRGYQIIDVGTHDETPVDYPDIAEALARSIHQGQALRGVLICGSGAGACIAVNKFKGIRASVCHDCYTAHQAVEHDDMNVLCLGARVIGEVLAKEIVGFFLEARFVPEQRYIRRLEKIEEFEKRWKETD